MRLPSVLAAHGRRFRVVLINTVILSVLALSISSQWWTNGYPGSVSPAEYRGPYVYHHDQTLAVIYFQADGQQISQCKLVLSEAGDPTDKIQLLNHFSETMPVIEVNFSEMMATIEVCNNMPAPPSHPPPQPEEEAAGLGRLNIMTLTRGILPGTLWCGVNDIAPDFSSLGVDRELDRCCRAHDHCPVKVKPFRTKYGMLNLDLYTKSHCYCDQKFYNCLKNNQDNKKAKAVGDFFFNVISVKCIEERVRRHCVQRSFNSSQPSRLDPEGKHFLNLGISFEVKNQTNCLKWQDEPGIKFFEFKARKPF